MTNPDPDKIQIIVFGPGFGESILVHIGDNKWIIIDSCLNDNKEPAALAHLRSIDVDPATNVSLVLVTHWHDDHTKGLYETLNACSGAEFAMSAALTTQEFLAYLIAHDRQPEMSIGRGGTEIIKCIRLMKNRKAPIKPVVQDRLIALWEGDSFSHGKRIELLALSPSDTQYADALLAVAGFKDVSSQKGALAVAKKRIPSENKNNLSIAVLLTIGESSLLLGADVEEMNHDLYGWTNIVANRRGRKPAPFFFKVAHHGSKGAHLDELWSDILTENPVSIVTPWCLGGKILPTGPDKERLKRNSGQAYITSTELISLKKRYDRSVLKDIDRSGIKLKPVIYKCGSVTLTMDAGSQIIEKALLTNTAALL
jgi:hypothetical protein